MIIDRKAFFDRVRGSLFAGKLLSSRVEGMSLLLDGWDARHAGQDLRWLAYALATVYHETAFTMQPVTEQGGVRYLTYMYDPQSPNPKRAAQALANGNTHPGDGVKYCGRGYVQLTWANNYRRIGDLIGLDLLSHPEKALEPEIAARILFEGMIGGWFSGVGLGRYLNTRSTDWKNARRIINGLDCTDQIAGYAKAFNIALA
ncbi:MAG: glycoside hydrolase family 19 protein [Asticcacaulis sp.]|uniref:glycoside hydrolase family 19 protein n=1 Tax=Asticcacaulis sp. TaxID=1872648 RepID=UPI0039E62BA7